MLKLAPVKVSNREKALVIEAEVLPIACAIRRDGLKRCEHGAIKPEDLRVDVEAGVAALVIGRNWPQQDSSGC